MADVGIGAISAPVVGVAQETEGAGSVVATPARKVKNCGQCNFPKVMACICVFDFALQGGIGTLTHISCVSKQNLLDVHFL